MKLLWFCLATVIAVVASNSAVDVERTVQQVQNILQANSQLPRLTRDEILQLLNDIRAEDAKSNSESKEHVKHVQKENIKTHNEPDIRENIVTDYKESTMAEIYETTTKREPSVMVVLPYTPRDGSSLQELYTKPPRIEVVPVSHVTPRPTKTVPTNEKRENKNQKYDLNADLQAFLEAHGFKGGAKQDHFLLPLDGFKPLPPAKVVDGTVQLPENILLTYDLIAPESDKKNVNVKDQTALQSQYLYEPLRPEIPFELELSSSETQESVLPLDLPSKRQTKSTSKTPNYEPIDYDSVKVIPLNNGPSPFDDDINLGTDLNKRQTNSSSEETTIVSNTTETAKDNAASAAAETDSGASLSDLEDSFGGAAPVEPGDSELPPPRKNGFYWMLDWNSFLEVGDGDTKVNIRFEPKLGDPQMFLPVNVP